MQGFKDSTFKSIFKGSTFHCTSKDFASILPLSQKVTALSPMQSTVLH